MTKRTTLPRMLTIQEFAERCSVSTKTVRRWLQSGELRGHLLGHQIRISEEDACTFLGARRR